MKENKKRISTSSLLILFIYRFFLVPIFTPVLFLISPLNRKIAEGLRLRRNKHRFVRRSPIAGQKVLWFHCASGEFEYARPVIRKIKEKSPDTYILVSYFSPTYRTNIEQDEGVDASCPLPLDVAGPVSDFLDEWRPTCLAISRTDIWPELLYQCRMREIPSLIFSVSLDGKQKKASGPLALLLGWRLSLIDFVYSVGLEDAQNLKNLPFHPKAIPLGDTRYDQVLYRTRSPKEKKLRARIFACPLFVAGSTWTQDEDVVISACASYLKERRIILILVPHEPTPSHIAGIVRRLTEVEVSSTLYSDLSPEVEVSPGSVVIVNTVGILIDLYGLTELSYVGGGFGRGVHSVMEALVQGSDVIVGPRFHNNREAIDFQKLDRGKRVRSIKCERELNKEIDLWLSRKQDFIHVKDHVVEEQNFGASDRLTDEILKNFL